MSASPSEAAIRTRVKRILHVLTKDLLKKGIKVNGDAGGLYLKGANVKKAALQKLVASNGEVCLLPYVVYQDDTVEKGFESFGKIQATSPVDKMD